jgi:hypothetical protein
LANYQIVPTTREHIHELARTMRQPNVDEVWSLAHLSPAAALYRSVANTPEPVTGLADDKVLCIFGVGANGHVWLLASNEIPKHPITVMREGRKWLKAQRTKHPRLSNYADASNPVAARWLTLLGFTVLPPIVRGLEKELFAPFEMVS